MRSVPGLARLPWVWFTAWMLVGAGYALSFIAIASIGLLVLPLPVLATLLLVRRRQATSGLPGLMSGLAVPVLYVAYLNRGPDPGLSAPLSPVGRSAVRNGVRGHGWPSA